jgi:hypothetical protein
LKPNYAKSQMRRLNNSDYRKEQFRFKALFKEYAPHLKIEMEYRVFSTDGALIAIIDFADITNKIAYRMRKAQSYHDSYRQELHDDKQKELLENRGWTVEEISEDTFEWYWLFS